MFATESSPARAPYLPILDPRQMGATGDGKTLDSAAINAAIRDCHDAGGGMVYISPGNYLCGTVVLKSNVTLYLEAGATILGSTRISDYNPKHLIYARNEKNIGLSGPGALQGSFERQKCQPMNC